MSTMEMIVEELKSLPAPKLAEAAVLIHRLKESSFTERLAALDRSAGVWSGTEGAEIERAIKEGCDRIDPRDW